MTVTIIISCPSAKHSKGRFDVTLDEGSTAAAALNKLQIDFDEFGLLVSEHKIIFLDDSLHDGQEVSLLPAISGG